MIPIMFDPIFERLASLATRRERAEAGDCVFLQGRPSKALHLVLAGVVRLERLTSHGERLILRNARDGQILAEAALDVECYHCDAIAAEPSELAVVEREAFETQFERDPRFARAWARKLALSLARARGRAEIVAQKTVAMRLDAWLAANGPLPERGNWRALADEIAVRPEALYRELARRRPTGENQRE